MKRKFQKLSHSCSRILDPKMQKWNIWPASSASRNFKLHLEICHLKGLSLAGLPNNEKTNLTVQIEWRHPRRLNGYLFGSVVVKNCTSKQCIQSDGSVYWNEGFDHEYKLKLMHSHHFRSRDINLEVHGLGLEPNHAASILTKVRVNIAEFASPTKGSEKTIRIPVKCSINGYITEAELTVTLKFFEFQNKGNNSTLYPLSKALLPSLSSCVRLHHHLHRNRLNPEAHPDADFRDHRFSRNQSKNSSTTESPSDDEPEFNYRNLAATNLLVGLVNSKPEYSTDDNLNELQSPIYQATQQPSLVRLLSWNKRKLSFRTLSHPRDTPLLNKAGGRDGGDDNDWRYELIAPQLRQVHGGNDLQPSGFVNDDRFEVGTWEERRLVSRDGQLELVTEIFLASIDQRSEKAAGGSACTVLAAVIADWLHQNPKILPLRCQFDYLVREGSSEWRNLCKKENHKEKFLDQHFDLDTVLQAKVRPLSIIPEKSYVGFFVLENMPNHLEFLEGAMSFDSIWEELQSREVASEEQIYIVSWNDHFFLLKVEADVIYIIDTLGERLFEGCSKAYILKFNRESRVYRVQPEPSNQKVESKVNAEDSSRSAGTEEDNKSSGDDIIVCEGKTSCKEFIKGFLAALPLRELQADIERGLMGEVPLHHRLQIEFHFTAPCSKNSQQNMQTKS